MAKISVITPLYNREGIVQKTIDSVLNQTFTDWEHIIVDDGSTDKSWFVISSYAEMDSRIRVFKRHKAPQCASTCRNIGVEYSTADLILFLDSDDLLEPHCLEQRYTYMTNNQHVDLGVFPYIREIETESNKFIRGIVHPEMRGNDFLRRFLAYDIPWQTTAPVWRKHFFLSLGGFNVEFQRYQDIELTVRALIHKATIEIVSGYPPDYVYYTYFKSFDFDTQYNVQLNLLKYIASIISIQERKPMVVYLEMFLQNDYRKQTTFANFKRTIRLISKYYNCKIISFKQMILLKSLILFQLINSHISKRNQMVYQKHILRISMIKNNY